MTGLAHEALEHHPISDLYEVLRSSAVSLKDYEQALKRMAAKTDSEVVIEVKRGGKRCAIHLRQFNVGDVAGRAVGRGLLLRDVTREHEIDEFKSTLLAAVGHELRTPLAAIKGYASTLLQQDVEWAPEDQHYFLQTISSEADRLARLVRNLLDLSRQEAGLLLLNRSPVKLQDLVTKLIERQAQSGSQISVQLPADLPPVHIDSARIEVVLQNLIANALAYANDTVIADKTIRELSL